MCQSSSIEKSRCCLFVAFLLATDVIDMKGRQETKEDKRTTLSVFLVGRVAVFTPMSMALRRVNSVCFSQLFFGKRLLTQRTGNKEKEMIQGHDFASCLSLGRKNHCPGVKANNI